MAETSLLLIRHAESVLNASGRWQGLTDAPLSDRGRVQARALAESVAGPLDAIVASDLSRALETAGILGARHRLEPVADPSLRELDVGAWSGLTREEIEARWPEALARFDSGDPDARAVDGESRRELADRVRPAVARIAREHAGRRVALVTHLGVIAAVAPGTRLGNAECVRCEVAALALEPAGSERWAV